VLLVSPYALSVPGGAQSQVAAIARELAHRGVEVAVCSPGEVDGPLVAEGVVHVARGKVLSLPANGSRAPVTLSWSAAQAFASRAASMRDGVVHVHEPFAPLAAYALLHQHRAATVATFHRGGGGPAYTAGRPLIRRLSRGIDVATAVSHVAAQTIRAEADIDATVLFNGFEVDRIRQATPASASGPTVLFVGRHEPRKGLGVLLDAVAKLDRPLHCWVIGDGQETAELRRRHGSDPRIVWLGIVSDDEKFARLAGADILCVPSLGGESFGLVPLEGMAAGTAVVASDIPGYREATAGHATLVPPGDASALAAALDRLFADPPGDDALEAARAHAAGWSIPALVDRYVELYAEAVDRFAAARAK
jgi:phosphatidylinositol alpha-mannosyltransferase